MSPFERDSFNIFSNTSQLVRDIHAIRETAEQLEIHQDARATEPYEAIDAEIVPRADRSSVAERFVEQFMLARQEAADRHEDVMRMGSTIAEYQQEGNELLGRLVDLGDDILFCIERIESLTVTGVKHLATIVDILGATTLQLEQMEIAAATRHVELIQAIKDEFRRRLKTEADERYRQAMVQFNSGHVVVCIKTLKEALKADGTHIPALILFGRIAAKRGQTGIARQSFCRARDYAREASNEYRNESAFVAASLQLSRLETVAGNLQEARGAVFNALLFVPTDSPHRDLVEYQHIKAVWAIEENRTESVAKDAAEKLQGLFERNAKLRDEVETLSLFVTLREFCPFLKPGPYGRLYDACCRFERERKQRTMPRYPALLELEELVERTQDLLRKSGYGFCASDAQRMVLDYIAPLLIEANDMLAAGELDRKLELWEPTARLILANVMAAFYQHPDRSSAEKYFEWATRKIEWAASTAIDSSIVETSPIFAHYRAIREEKRREAEQLKAEELARNLAKQAELNRLEQKAREVKEKQDRIAAENDAKLREEGKKRAGDDLLLVVLFIIGAIILCCCGIPNIGHFGK